MIGIAVLALVGGYFAVNSVSNTERTTTTSIPDVREIVVNVDSGSITLTGTADNQVGIGTVLRGSAFDEPVANHDLVQGVLSITASCSGPSCVVEESIAVPDGIPVSLRTAGRLASRSSTSESRNSRRKVGSGSLVASFASAPQKIDITIGSGNVELRVPDVGYQLDVSTGTGSLDVGIPQDHSAPRSLVVRTTTGNVSGAGDLIPDLGRLRNSLTVMGTSPGGVS